MNIIVNSFASNRLKLRRYNAKMLIETTIARWSVGLITVSFHYY